MATITLTHQPALFHPSKRQRLASSPSSSSSSSCRLIGKPERYGHGRSKSARTTTGTTSTSTTLASAPRASCLEALPAELLNIILNISFEASLIHVSRQLRTKLPSFVAFTQSLALQSLLPLKEWKHTGAIECYRGSEIEHLLRTLDIDTQDIIRKKTFAASWLSEDRVNATRHTLLNWTIHKTCAIYLEKPPSLSQLGRIRAFVDTQRTAKSNFGSDLRLKPQGEGNQGVQITASPYEVEVSAAGGRDFPAAHQSIEFRVVDFGHSIPDFLLQHPLTSTKQDLLSRICNWKGTKDCEIQCNLDLLGALIMHCINLDHLSTFSELLRLAASTSLVLDLVHIKRVVVLGRWRMLTPLLKHTWRLQSPYRLADSDLIRLIDEAKVNAYPECNDTTRILAMEVAALWKIAEVEGAGGSTTRIYTQWPPCLEIKMPGDRWYQTWYIPKDPRREVDWESSQCWGWIQKRMHSPS